MKRLSALLLCMILSAAALADGAASARKRAVGSMVVTGHIEVLQDGSAGRYDIDRSSKLPPAVVQLIAKSIPRWQFEPVAENGRPVIAKSTMSLRVIASPVAGGKYAVSISGADFGQEMLKPGASSPTDVPSEKNAPKPSYPPDLVAEHVTGTVYVLLRINRAGNIEDATAQQVNLRLAASDMDMRRYRSQLALAATSALKHWTFNIPTTGKHADDGNWFARVPVDFNIEGNGYGPPGYGEWDVYVPGPIESAPWIDSLPKITDDKLLTENVDATPAGGSFFSSGGLHLITKLNGG